MDPIASMIGVNQVRRYATSALPDAPVVPERPRRESAPGPLRRATAHGLRGIAERLAPAGVHVPQPR